jgi:hypothetical protein
MPKRVKKLAVSRWDRIFKGGSLEGVCVFITAGPITKLFVNGRIYSASVRTL